MKKCIFLLSVFLTDNHYSEKLSPAWAALIGNRPVSVKKRLKGGKKADITRFITYCRSLLERRLSTGLTISAHDSLVEELRTDLAFRTACLNLRVHYAYWPYDRLYVAESSAPYNHNQEKVKADKDFNSLSEHWTV